MTHYFRYPNPFDAQFQNNFWKYPGFYTMAVEEVGNAMKAFTGYMGIASSADVRCRMALNHQVRGTQGASADANQGVSGREGILSQIQNGFQDVTGWNAVWSSEADCSKNRISMLLADVDGIPANTVNYDGTLGEFSCCEKSAFGTQVSRDHGSCHFRTDLATLNIDFSIINSPAVDREFLESNRKV